MTTDKTKSFFGGVQAPDRSSMGVLPTAKSKGAPAGARYTLECIDAEVRWGENSGDPYVHLQATVILPQEWENRRVFENMFFTEKSLPYTFAALTAMIGDAQVAQIVGENPEEAANQVAEAIVGARFIGKLGIEKGKDGYDPKNRIREYVSLDAAAADAATPAKKARRFG